MSTDHNQRLGFQRYGKSTKGREEQRSSRYTKQQLREVRITEAKDELLATNKFKQVLSVIGGGKEATVLLAEDISGNLVCAKVFRYFTSTIKKRLRGTKHILASEMAQLAAKQEYWNLKEMKVRRIPVPKPHLLIGNIVTMEFIPEIIGSTIPAPLIRDVDLKDFDDPEEFLHESIDILASLFLEAQFVHGDYSEHNLMIYEGELITMDVSQSVQYNPKTFIDTPVRIRIDRALNYLNIDLLNIIKHFKRYRISIDPNEVIHEITNKLPQKLLGFLDEKTMDIYPSELYTPEMYSGKERYRNELVFKRTGTTRQQPKP